MLRDAYRRLGTMYLPIFHGSIGPVLLRVLDTWRWDRYFLTTNLRLATTHKSKTFSVISVPAILMYFCSFLILYSYQWMHNCFTNYHIPTCFDTIVSSSGSLWSIPCQDTQVFQMQLLVIQFTIKMFHTGFVQVLVLYSLKSQYYKILKTLKLSYLK